MRYGRSGKGRGGHADGSFWICFSDLMSALMLVFVLVMFYSVYQYFDMLEVKTAELLRQSGLLDQQQEQLNLSQQELQEKEEQLNAQSAQLDEQSAQLDAQSAKLTEAETELLAQQAKMLLQEQTLDALQARLDEQEKALQEAESRQQAQQALLDEQQVKLDRLVGVRAAIIEELLSALRASNITGANVDNSGAIVFDSEMMFEVGSSRLNETGKEFLNSFLPNYLRVLMSSDYSRYVSQIIIEGHTDDVGSFMTNAELSQDRALEVLRYIMSDEFSGVSAADKRRLESLVTANGRSYSEPVLNEDGSVNRSASRRVVIKFRLNDEDMVTEMLDVLNSME